MNLSMQLEVFLQFLFKKELLGKQNILTSGYTLISKPLRTSNLPLLQQHCFMVG